MNHEYWITSAEKLDDKWTQMEQIKELTTVSYYNNKY